MKLRFRVSCWDEAPSLAVPPPIPTSASRFARREDPLLQSFGDLVQGEGLESPCLYPLLGRRQPDGHLSSWSRTAAVKRCWTARDRGRLGSEERGDVEDRSRDKVGSGPRPTPSRQQQIEDGEDGLRRRQHPAVQVFPISPACCCVIISDPATSLVPEQPFPKVMLTDRSRRASFFSLTQTVLNATPEGSSLSRCRDELWQCNAGDIGAGRSVVKLLRRTPPALPEAAATEAPAILQEQQQQQQRHSQRFQTIPLDLDEEAFAVLRGILPSDATASLYPGNPAEEATPSLSPFPRSTWGALDLDHMLKPWPLNLQQGAPSPAWRTPAKEPQPVRLELQSSGGRSRLLDTPAMSGESGLARGGGDAESPLLPAGSEETACGLPQVFERSVGCFTRITADGFGDEDGLPEPEDGNTASLKRSPGLLGLLGSVRREKQLDTADKARCSPLACFDPPCGFHPTSLSVGSSLFPGRSPPIPMTTVRSSSGVWARQQRRRRPPEWSAEGWVPGRSRGGASLGAIGDGRVQDERGLLDPLWTALVKGDILGQSLSSPQPLLWALAPRRKLAGRAGEHRGLLKHVSSLRSPRPVIWSSKTVAARTDKLLEGMLASWRKMNALPPPHPPPSSTGGRGQDRRRARPKHTPPQQSLPQTPQTPPPPPPVLAPPTAPAPTPAVSPPAPQQLPSAKTPFPAKPDAAAIPGHHTQEASALALGAGAASLEAPAYEGAGLALGDSQPHAEGAETAHPSRTPRGSASLDPGVLNGGGDDGSRPSKGLLPAKEGGAAVSTPSPSEREGAGPPVASSKSKPKSKPKPNGKAVPRGKRKLDGVNWTFGGAAGGARKGVRDRAPPTPAPVTATSHGGSRPLSETMEGSGCRPPGEVPSASRGCRDSGDVSSVGQNNDNAGPPQAHASPDAAPQDRRLQAKEQPGVESPTPRGSRADDAGAPKPRHTVPPGVSDDGAATEAAGLSRPKKKSLPATGGPPPTPSGLVAGARKAETGPSSTQAAGRSWGGLSPSAPTPDGGAATTTTTATTATATATAAAADARDCQSRPSREAPAATDEGPASAGEMAPGVARRSLAKWPASPSRCQNGAASARPAAARDIDGDGDVPRPASPAEGVPHERCVAGQKRGSPDRDGLGRGEAHGGGSGGDIALDGCESSRQREILAAIRSGAIGDTFDISRGQTRRSSSGSAGQGRRQLASATPGTSTGRRASEPWVAAPSMDDVGEGLHVPGASSASPPEGDAPSTKAQAVSYQAGKPAAAASTFPLYAIASEGFLDKAGSMVLALSASTRAPPPPAASPAEPPTRSTSAVDATHSRRTAAGEAAGGAHAGVGDGGAAGAGAAATSAPARRGGRFRLLELPVGPPVDLVVGSRSGVAIFDNRDNGGDDDRGTGGVKEKDRGWDGKAAAAAESNDADAEREAELADAKETLRLLQQQTLKFSTLVVIFQMDKARVVGGASGARKDRGLRLRPGLAKLEQWLVGFPCRVLIRYSYSDTQLAELITHAAVAAQWGGRSAGAGAGAGAGGPVGVGVGISGATPEGKRRRLMGAENASSSSSSFTAPRGEARALAVSSGRGAAGARSPLETIEERSRHDPDWAAWHYRQAWFLQLFPTLNAFSASALLSSASLKHLIVAPYEELAPALLGKGAGGSAGSGGGGGGGGGGGKGGVSAESLRDFCAAVRHEGGRGQS